jgi:xanthine/CO dehydrogenase XdhC/CoxF family maturation factor
MTELYDELEQLLEHREQAAVATIVRTRGSTPREVGARMIVRPDGRAIGTVGGGCGEAEVWAEAQDVLATGRPRLIEVDLLHDHDLEGGRACGGLMYVFIEPLTLAAPDAPVPE